MSKKELYEKFVKDLGEPNFKTQHKKDADDFIKDNKPCIAIWEHNRTINLIYKL